MQTLGFIYMYAYVYDFSNNFENLGLLIWGTWHHESEIYGPVIQVSEVLFTSSVKSETLAT